MFFPAPPPQVRARMSAELQRRGCLQLGQEAWPPCRGPGVVHAAPAQPGCAFLGPRQVAVSVSGGISRRKQGNAANEVRQREKHLVKVGCARGNDFFRRLSSLRIYFSV